MSYTVLVCGGRDYGVRRVVFDVLDMAHSLSGPIGLLVHGGATGADALAGEWAAEHGVEVRRFEADWLRYGRAAGPKRNRRMLREAKPDYVIAFPGGDGTANMVEQARAAGVNVVRISCIGDRWFPQQG